MVILYAHINCINWTLKGFGEKVKQCHEANKPALLDIPTILFFCFQKLMSFLKARKSKRS